MSKSEYVAYWMNEQKGGLPKTWQDTGKANNKTKEKESGRQSNRLIKFLKV